MRRLSVKGRTAGWLVGAVLTYPMPGMAAQHRAKTHASPSRHTPAPLPLTARERVEQVLDRFTYGPRPGEIDRVLTEGGESWFEQQLNPSVIPDAVLNRRLADLPTIAMTPEQALAVFPDRPQVVAVAEGRMPMPTDPLQRTVMEVQVAKWRGEANRKQPQPAGTAAGTAASPQTAAKPADESSPEDREAVRATAIRINGELLAMPKERRMAALIAMPVADRIAFTENGNLPGPQREQLLRDCTPREREAFLAMAGRVNTTGALGNELAQAHALRDILSERQVETVMTDLWFNHFNVFLDKGPDRWYTASYERDVIRPHALGKFSDLLLATASSPAMMVYLDNLQSIGPNSVANGVNPNRPNPKRGTRGLNENYGREVMELHTVGANGGYSQADVTALAAILTGWGVDRPQDGGPFVFEPRRHEPGAKAWFGYCLTDDGRASKLPADSPKAAAACEASSGPATAAGMQQGIAALKLLAASPQTAHAVAGMLAQYFVADSPPPALVDRLTQIYLSSDGDIKAMLRTMVSSPEFNSRQYFRTKVKTPMEFLASAYRSTATDPQNPGAIVNQARTMGMPLYGALPPTGYYLTADQWMNSTALVDRLNFAYQLSGGKVPNQHFDGSHVLALGLIAADSLPTGTEPRGAERSPTAAETSAKPERAALHTTAAVEPAADAKAAIPPISTGTQFATRLLAQVVTGGPVSSKTSRLIETQVAVQAASQAAAGPQNGNSGQAVDLIVGLLLGSPEFQLR